MTRLDLGRLLRGPHRRAVEDVAALLPSPPCLEDERGRAVIGERREGERHAIVVGDREIGAVWGAGGATLARLVAHLYEREQEKLALANETLGRYKELTVLYDLTDALSRVLEVREIARMVVEEAHRFLRAGEAVLFLVDPRHEKLDPIGAAGESRSSGALPIDEGLEGRVVRTGQAEIVEEARMPGEDAPRSQLCAPLRSGESVFGILRVTSAANARWTAGELKLVTSLAGSAASAISHAVLHQEQLRKQALRSRIERFVGPTFVEHALEGRSDSARSALAVLFCDLAEVVSGVDADLRPEEVLDTMGAAMCVALDALLAHGATVNTTNGEMLVALFPHDDGFDAAARAATDAALALARALDRRGGGPLVHPPGIGVVGAEAASAEEHEAVVRSIGLAATLQAAADGRVLIDERVADAVRAHARVDGPALAEPRAYEVRG